jgi:hypothetical protein
MMNSRNWDGRENEAGKESRPKLVLAQIGVDKL